MALLLRLAALILVCVAPPRAVAQVVPDVMWLGGTSPRYYDASTPDAACTNAAGILTRTSGTETTTWKFVRSALSTSGASAVCWLSYIVTSSDPKVAPVVGPASGQEATVVTKLQCDSAKPYFSSATRSCVATAPTPPPVSCTDKNEFVRRWDYPGSASTGAPEHYGGCKIIAMKVLVCRKETSGLKYCMWLVKRTGDPYTGPTDVGGGGGSDSPDKPALPPVNSPPIVPKPDDTGGKGACPEGTVQAGVTADGMNVCVGQGSNPRNPPANPPKSEVSKNVTLPDGSVQTTTTTTTTNSDGSTTTQTTVVVTKPDGTKTTNDSVSTTNNGAGQPGQADTPEKDKTDFCKQNPQLSICRESSTSGTCGQIMCVGDAIQCATLRAAAAMECKQRTDEQALKDSPLTAKGNAAIAGTDIVAEKLPSVKNAEVVTLQPLSSGSAGFLGGGSPFPDVSFSLQGQSFVLPFAKWTGYLVALRYALMVVASLVSFRILSGAILRE